MGNKLNLKGQKFGRLTAIKEVGVNNAGIYNWLCKCECGSTTIVRASNLRNKNTQSCGCLNIEIRKFLTTKHGKSSKRTPEYVAWQNMKNRCYGKSSSYVKNYSGRGISVCHQWRDDFSQFLKDMGERPSQLHSLDRYPNNDGNYEPNNCRWAILEQQSRGKRSNHWLIHNGERRVINDWGKILGTCAANIRHHLKKMSFSDFVIQYKLKHEE